MSIKVTFECDTVEEAIVLLGKHVDEQNPPVVTTTKPGPAAGAADDANKTVAKLAPAKAAQVLIDEHNLNVADITGTGKGGRITKGDVEKYFKSIAPEPVDPVKKESGSEEGGESEVTIDVVRDKLKELNGAKDMDTCLKVLSHFGVKRVSDLEVDQYQKFIDKCNDVINGGKV